MLHTLRQAVLTIAGALYTVRASVQAWPRMRVVAVTCIGPFTAVVLSWLGYPFISVVAFGTGVVFFHIATQPPVSSAPIDPPVDVEV